MLDFKKYLGSFVLIFLFCSLFKNAGNTICAHAFYEITNPEFLAYRSPLSKVGCTQATNLYVRNKRSVREDDNSLSDALPKARIVDEKQIKFTLPASDSRAYYFHTGLPPRAPPLL